MMEKMKETVNTHGIDLHFLFELLRMEPTEYHLYISQLAEEEQTSLKQAIDDLRELPGMLAQQQDASMNGGGSEDIANLAQYLQDLNVDSMSEEEKEQFFNGLILHLAPEGHVSEDSSLKYMQLKDSGILANILSEDKIQRMDETFLPQELLL